ncbi:MAG: NUDIX hydrolase [Planctomycetota bacterium]|jgi:ADP-ribose pyrophosphatase
MSGTPHVETTHRGRLLTVEVLAWSDADGREVRREVVRHPGAVVVVPVLDDGRLVLIRNHRVAVGARLWELPAGTLEDGEPAAAAAGRELIEETGYRAATIDRLGGFYTTPGFCDEHLEVFLARGLAFEGQRLDPGERIEAEPIDEGEVLAMIDDGRIADGKTIAGVFLWRRRRERDEA